MFRNVFNANPMQRLTMVNTVFVGLCDLRTFFYIYEQFISVLWNFFLLKMSVSPRGRGGIKSSIAYYMQKGGGGPDSM